MRNPSILDVAKGVGKLEKLFENAPGFLHEEFMIDFLMKELMEYADGDKEKLERALGTVKQKGGRKPD